MTVQKLESRKYKWAYTDSQYDETDIYSLVISDGIELENWWKIAGDDTCKKLSADYIKTRLHHHQNKKGKMDPTANSHCTWTTYEYSNITNPTGPP